MIDDAELLRRYAENRSEPAFAELVKRHVNMVYAAALRRVGGDSHLAEEVAQVVFTTLARKAGSLARHPVLIGWLHRSTHYAAIDALREKLRREQRELPIETESMNANAETNRSHRADVDWEEVRPVIDSLLDQLNERDRGALLLRFFEGHSFSQVGARLSLSEDAARMRVERAMEKLRSALARRGITSTTAALGVALANQAAAVAPAGVAASVTGAALAGVAAGGGSSALLTFLTMSKIKVGIGGLLVIVGAATAVREIQASGALREEIRSLSRERLELREVSGENQRLGAALAIVGESNPDVGELTRMRGRIAQLKARPDGVLDSEMKPVSAWRNAGSATPADSYETMLWAQAVGDADVFARFITFSSAGKAKLDAFFAKLPESVRLSYGTPEKMVALSNPTAARTTIVSFQPIGRTDHGSRVMVTAWTREQSGRERKHEVLFQAYPDGWRAAPLPDKTADAIIASLDPATGKRLSTTP